MSIISMKWIPNRDRASGESDCPKSRNIIIMNLNIDPSITLSNHADV